MARAQSRPYYYVTIINSARNIVMARVQSVFGDAVGLGASIFIDACRSGERRGHEGHAGKLGANSAVNSTRVGMVAHAMMIEDCCRLNVLSLVAFLLR